MTGKLSLLKRTGNRTSARPPVGIDGNGADSVFNELLPNKERRLNEKRARSDANCFLWNNLGGKLYFPPDVRDVDWKPSLNTVFKLLFSIRVASSFWSIISDCDEVYNYWEPLHLLLFGRGFQTWEYSPIYAIRSWFYICVHALPAQLLFPIFTSSKVAFFHVLRFLIAFLSLIADICLLESACRRLGNMIGLLFIVFSMFSVGMFGASCAFLPSSFSMTLNTFAMAAYLREKWFLAIFCTCVSAVVGWPFAAILGFPIVFEMLVLRTRNLALKFIGFSLLSAALVVPALYLIDSHYYGKNVVAPLNIVFYNVFSKHGPELYGVEPMSFYFKNLFLHWNIILGFALLSIPLSLYVYVVNNGHEIDDNGKPTKRKNIGWSMHYWYRYVPVCLIFVSALLWLTIFTLQAHKEERFIFPIFPLIALLGAIGLDAFLRISSKFSFIGIATLTIFITLSASRGYALHRNYSASLEVYRSFNDYFVSHQRELDFSTKQDPIRVCVGKEWHRFPSSFFLPESVVDKRDRKRAVELRFIESEFRGLLPKHFAQGPIPNITRLIPSAMNDLNLEEKSRYVPLATCDYLVDFVSSRTSEQEPNYAEMKDTFSVLIEKPFLIAADSHPIFRAFYIPFTNNRLRFGSYVVLEKVGN